MGNRSLRVAAAEIAVLGVLAACVGDDPTTFSFEGTDAGSVGDASSPPTEASACAATLCGTTCADVTRDSSNCGACGVRCAEGSVCAKSQCVDIVTTVATIDETKEQTYGVAVDDTAVYFTTWPICSTEATCAEGRILSKPKRDLGAALRVIAERQAMPSRLVLAGGRLVWSSWYPGGAVRSLSVSAAGLGPVVEHIAMNGGYGLAVVDRTAYVSRFNSGSGDVIDVDLMTASDAGAPSVLIGPGLGGAELRSLASDGARLYWTYKSGVRSLPLGSRVVSDAGSPELREHVAGLTTGDGIAVDATHIYFADRARGTLGRIRKDDATRTVEDVAAGLGDTRAILLDGAALFVASQGQGKVYRVALTPGFPKVVLADSLNSVQELAVDDTFVYVSGSSKITRIAKER